MDAGAVGEFAILRCIDRSEETVRFGMIVVPNEGVADLVLKRLKAGERFERLSEEYSTDASRSKGGDMGEFRMTDLRDELRTALQSIKAGELTGIIRVK
jgi:parvulin-like peptidyl-prolyl isomerase